MVERQLPKLHTRVRFPSPAPIVPSTLFQPFSDRAPRQRGVGMATAPGRYLVFASVITIVAATPAVSRAQAYNPVTQQAQTRLAALGYDPGPLDGTLSPATRATIRAYQRQSGLRETGGLDDATLHRLGVQTSVGLARSVRDWAALPTQPQLDLMLLAPINDPRFPYTDYRPNAPGADLDIPGATILAAMNASADRFGSRRPGQRRHTSIGYRQERACLLSPFSTTHWSDLSYHYYCQLSLATRSCYSRALVGLSLPIGRTYSRVEAYRGCAEKTLLRAEGFAWVAKNQPIVFQYVTYAQTNGFDHAQEQAVINAFYGIKNPADRTECRAKRPLRLEDPTDGTHCLVNKTMRERLVGRGS
jgi:peptidoglycan hydrolase-like protein with peptidoglycan-binding domain